MKLLHNVFFILVFSAFSCSIFSMDDAERSLEAAEDELVDEHAEMVKETLLNKHTVGSEIRRKVICSTAPVVLGMTEITAASGLALASMMVPDPTLATYLQIAAGATGASGLSFVVAGLGCYGDTAITYHRLRVPKKKAADRLNKYVVSSKVVKRRASQKRGRPKKRVPKEEVEEE